jgi:prevent-host-death family protein
MKEKRRLIKTPSAETEPLSMRETAIAAEAHFVSVREAKARLSALLEWVSGGREITITSDGKAKARLVPAAPALKRKVFRGMGAWLLSQPVHGGPTADELVREDRDGRGW